MTTQPVKGLYELEKTVEAFLSEFKYPCTEQTLAEFILWSRQLNDYISSLDGSQINRIIHNYRKYNAMFITTVGLRTLHERHPNWSDLNHHLCLNNVYNTLDLLTARMGAALV